MGEYPWSRGSKDSLGPMPSPAEKTVEIISAVRQEIETGFIYLWRREHYEIGIPVPEDQGLMLRHLAKELAFARKVIFATLSLAIRHSGPITVMYDLDGAVVQERFKHYPHDLLWTRTRPAFPVVVRVLDEVLGARVDNGIFSSRDQWKLDGEMAYPTYLADVMAKINRNFVINPGQHHEKGSEFEKLVNSNPGRAFVAVDDNQWVLAISPDDPRAIGVYLDKESNFDFIDQIAIPPDKLEDL